MIYCNRDSYLLLSLSWCNLLTLHSMFFGSFMLNVLFVRYVHAFFFRSFLRSFTLCFLSTNYRGEKRHLTKKNCLKRKVLNSYINSNHSGGRCSSCKSARRRRRRHCGYGRCRQFEPSRSVVSPAMSRQMPRWHGKRVLPMQELPSGRPRVGIDLNEKGKISNLSLHALKFHCYHLEFFLVFVMEL